MISKRDYNKDVHYKKRNSYFEFVYENCTKKMTNMDIDSLTYKIEYNDGKYLYHYRFVEYKELKEPYKGFQKSIFSNISYMCDVMNNHSTDSIWDVIIVRGDFKKDGYFEITDMKEGITKKIFDAEKLKDYFEFKIDFRQL